MYLIISASVSFSKLLSTFFCVEMCHCFLYCRNCGLIFSLKSARNNFCIINGILLYNFLLLSHKEIIPYRTYLKHCIIVMEASGHMTHARKYREQSTLLHYSSWEIWSHKKCLGYLIAFCSLLQGFQWPPSETCILLMTACSVPDDVHCWNYITFYFSYYITFFQLLTFLRSYHYWCQKVKCICNNLGWRAHSELIV